MPIEQVTMWQAVCDVCGFRDPGGPRAEPGFVGRTARGPHYRWRIADDGTATCPVCLDRASHTTATEDT